MNLSLPAGSHDPALASGHRVGAPEILDAQRNRCGERGPEVVRGQVSGRRETARVVGSQDQSHSGQARVQRTGGRRASLCPRVPLSPRAGLVGGEQAWLVGAMTQRQAGAGGGGAGGGQDGGGPLL